MSAFLIKSTLKKISRFTIHYIIAIIIYRSVYFINSFYSPKLLDEHVLDHFVSNNNNLDIFRSTILESLDTNGNNLEVFDCWQLIKYAFFVSDFYPNIQYIKESNGVISVSLSGYHHLTWKNVCLDKQMRVVSVQYFRKIP